MIVKDADEMATTADTRALAGRRAEDSVAFYLRRAFQDKAAIYVLNDLRLVRDDDAAQIDHLIIHDSGAIIVESKSVTSKVQINERGEWERLWDNHWRGMPSPIKQAEMQGEFLHDWLRRNRTEILGKIIGMQKGFGAWQLDTLVAISADGSFSRTSVRPPEAHKADQIVDQIRALIERQRKQTGLIGKFVSISAAETKILAERLHADHRPRKPVTQAVVPPPQPRAAEAEAAGPTICRHCGSSEGNSRKGRYGPYFACSACGKNTTLAAKGDRPAGAAPPVPEVTVPPAKVSAQAAPPIVESTPIAFVAGPSTDGAILCRYCGSPRGETLKGRYGPYLKCGDCGKNTGLKGAEAGA